MGSSINHIPAGILNKLKKISVMYVSFLLSFFSFSQFFCKVGSDSMAIRCKVSIVSFPDAFGMSRNATPERYVTSQNFNQ